MISTQINKIDGSEAIVVQAIRVSKYNMPEATEKCLKEFMAHRPGIEQIEIHVKLPDESGGITDGYVMISG